VAVCLTTPLRVNEVVHDEVPLQTLQFDELTSTMTFDVPFQKKGVAKVIVAQPAVAGGV
jgi:hypothetical protein